MEIVTIERKHSSFGRKNLTTLSIVWMPCVFLCGENRISGWITAETCRLLNVSARTMQTYRDTGKLPYSQINNKIYYKVSDVETFMQNHVKNNSKK